MASTGTADAVARADSTVAVATSVAAAVASFTVTIAVAIPRRNRLPARTFAATAFAAFGGDDQLQQAFGVGEEFIGGLRIQAQGVRGQLLRDGGTRDSGIGGNEADFVDVNVRIALQSRFQLFGKLHRLRTGTGRENRARSAPGWLA